MYGVLALVGGREPTPFFRSGIVVSIVANHISKSMFGMQLYSTKGLLGITRGVAPRSRPGGLYEEVRMALSVRQKKGIGYLVTAVILALAGAALLIWTATPAWIPVIINVAVAVAAVLGITVVANPET